MEILWLAILFYSVGLAAVLHYRPALMFNENGTWKEFGYHRAASARYTIFPFWLFAIAWAIISYTAAAAFVWAWRSSPSTAAATALMASERAVRFAGFPEEEEEEGDEFDDSNMMPVSAMPEPVTETIRMRPSAKRIQTPARQPRMGYYVLDPASEKSGLRRYVYYGNAPPPEVSSKAGNYEPFRSELAPSRPEVSRPELVETNRKPLL
jgi:hypothetical protein